MTPIVKQRRVTYDDLGLGGGFGPFSLPCALPTNEAYGLSVSLVPEAVARLRAKQEAGEPIGYGRGELKFERASVDRIGPLMQLGLPLTASVSSQMMELFSLRVLGLRAPERKRRPGTHARIARRLTEHLSVERQLWRLAYADASGWIAPHLGRMPFAFANLALRWCWNPDAHYELRTRAICLRCGDISRAARRRDGTYDAMLRCRPCVVGKQSIDSPSQAVMPAFPPDWWMRCGECREVFIGRRNAECCRDCRQRNTTPGRRRSAQRE